MTLSSDRDIFEIQATPSAFKTTRRAAGIRDLELGGLSLKSNLALIGLLACVAPGMAHAQQASPAERPAADAPRPAPSPAPSVENEDNEVEALVVTGGRPRGAVLGDIPPEETLSAADVRSFGVSSMQDLLAELSPQTTSGLGGAPVVLLNGRRISSFAEIRDIPTEAIQRVEILPEEVALKYGYSADQKVVNVVLRQRFRATTVEASLAAPTEGGQATEQANASRLRLNRDGRMNVAVKYQRSDALLESDRDLISSGTSGLYDMVGNVASTLNGGEIDPALSALAGQPITVAGVPASAATAAPSLAAFLPGANHANVSDLSDSRSLLPRTQQISANAVINRFVFGDVSATFNISGAASETTALLGPARARLDVPAGDPFSPFSQDVALYRYLGELGPLEQNARNLTGHLGFTLNRDTDDWRLSLTGNYDHAVNRTLTDRGVDLTGLQARLDALDPALNPFAPVAAMDFNTDRARSINDTANLQGVVNGALVRLPAGDLSTTVKLGVDATRLDAVSRRAGVETSSDLSRDNASVQVSFDLPIASRRNGVLPRLGDLSTNLNLAVSELSDFGTLTTTGYGLSWSPVKPVSFIVSVSDQENAPSIQQLGNPLVTTPDARVFDFVRGETVDVTRISGGNPDLRAEDRQVLKLGMTLRPPALTGLSVTANYTRSRIDDPVASFPAATAAVEAAFPDRFTRDANGDLLRIDSRPVNFARRDSDQIRWGFNYSRQIGKTPPRPAFEGGGQRFRDGPGRTEGPRSAPGVGTPGEGPTAIDPNRASAPSSPPTTDDGPRRGPAFGADGGGPPDGQRGFGGPGGPGGPGGFGRGGGRAARLQLAVFHTIHLRERILVQEGVPALDLLNGDVIGSGGGQPRHEIEAQAGVTKNGLGARLSANWLSATHVRGGQGGAATDLDFSDLATVNLRLFADFSGRRELIQAHPFLRGVRVNLAITNLFDSRVSVRDRDGLTPVTYQPDYLDPLGRSVQLTVRKLIF